MATACSCSPAAFCRACRPPLLLQSVTSHLVSGLSVPVIQEDTGRGCSQNWGWGRHGVGGGRLQNRSLPLKCPSPAPTQGTHSADSLQQGRPSRPQHPRMGLSHQLADEGCEAAPQVCGKRSLHQLLMPCQGYRLLPHICHPSCLSQTGNQRYECIDGSVVGLGLDPQPSRSESIFLRCRAQAEEGRKWSHCTISSPVPVTPT